MLEKTEAKTPSIVEAARLVRIPDLVIVCGCETGRISDAAGDCVIFKAGADKISTNRVYV